jgi:hypothetical protein
VITQCTFCSLNTAGQHELGCPSNPVRTQQHNKYFDAPEIWDDRNDKSQQRVIYLEQQLTAKDRELASVREREESNANIRQAIIAGVKKANDILHKELAEARQEIADLRDAETEYAEAYGSVIAEQCPTDEKHCTCVPFLRVEISRLKTELEKCKLRELDELTAKKAGPDPSEGEGV